MRQRSNIGVLRVLQLSLFTLDELRQKLVTVLYPLVEILGKLALLRFVIRALEDVDPDHRALAQCRRCVPVASAYQGARLVPNERGVYFLIAARVHVV